MSFPGAPGLSLRFTRGRLCTRVSPPSAATSPPSLSLPPSFLASLPPSSVSLPFSFSCSLHPSLPSLFLSRSLLPCDGPAWVGHGRPKRNVLHVRTPGLQQGCGQATDHDRASGACCVLLGNQKSFGLGRDCGCESCTSPRAAGHAPEASVATGGRARGPCACRVPAWRPDERPSREARSVVSGQPRARSSASPPAPLSAERGACPLQRWEPRRRLGRKDVPGRGRGRGCPGPGVGLFPALAWEKGLHCLWSASNDGTCVPGSTGIRREAALSCARCSMPGAPCLPPAPHLASQPGRDALLAPWPALSLPRPAPEAATTGHHGPRPWERTCHVLSFQGQRPEWFPRAGAGCLSLLPERLQGSWLPSLDPPPPSSWRAASCPGPPRPSAAGPSLPSQQQRQHEQGHLVFQGGPFQDPELRTAAGTGQPRRPLGDRRRLAGPVGTTARPAEEGQPGICDCVDEPGGPVWLEISQTRGGCHRSRSLVCAWGQTGDLGCRGQK